MFKLLMKIPAFKNAVINYKFESQKPKGNGFNKLSYAFIDKAGKKYYRFNDMMDLFMVRKGVIDTHIIELDAGISSGELGVMVQAMETAINNGVKPNFPMIGHIITEIKERQQWLVHGDIIASIMATVFIREDEIPYEIDEAVHSEKVELFSSELSFFLNSMDLREFLQLSNISKENLKTSLMNTQKQATSLMKQLKAYTSKPG